MTRAELLESAFGSGYAARDGDRIVEMTDEDSGAVLSHADLYLRRIVVVPVSAAGGVSEAATTITVAGIGNVCTDPAFRGRGYASAMVRRAHAEARENPWISFAAVFTTIPAFFARLGYQPIEARGEAAFMVASLDGDRWPECRFFDTNGEW